MGLDLYLKGKQCKECGQRIDPDLEFSYTYNATPMWLKMCPEDEKMIDIDGMTGAQAFPKLRDAFHNMKKQKEELILLEPPNGYGSYHGFYDFIIKLMDACIEYPDLVWDSWR